MAARVLTAAMWSIVFVGIETADHPTDGEIITHAKSYFKASDRMG